MPKRVSEYGTASSSNKGKFKSFKDAYLKKFTHSQILLPTDSLEVRPTKSKKADNVRSSVASRSVPPRSVPPEQNSLPLFVNGKATEPTRFQGLTDDERIRARETVGTYGTNGEYKETREDREEEGERGEKEEYAERRDPRGDGFRGETEPGEKVEPWNREERGNDEDRGETDQGEQQQQQQQLWEEEERVPEGDEKDHPPPLLDMMTPPPFFARLSKEVGNLSTAAGDDSHQNFPSAGSEDSGTGENTAESSIGPTAPFESTAPSIESSFWCEECQVDLFNQRLYDEHADEYHFETEWRYDENGDELGSVKSRIHCGFCPNLPEFRDLRLYDRHLISPQHLDRMYEEAMKRGWVTTSGDIQYHCDLCGRHVANDYEAYEVHLTGMGHRARLSQGRPNKREVYDPATLFPYYCDLCHWTTKEPGEYLEHLTSEKHDHRVKMRDVFGFDLNPPNSGPLADPASRAKAMYWCDICRATFTGLAQYDAHIVSTKHQKKASYGKVTTADVEKLNLASVGNGGATTGGIPCVTGKSKLTRPVDDDRARGPRGGLIQRPGLGTKAARSRGAKSCMPVMAAAQRDIDVKKQGMKQGHFSCVLCKVWFTREDQYLTHTDGAPHVKKVQISEILADRRMRETLEGEIPEGDLPLDAILVRTGARIDGKNLVCGLCDETCSDIEVMLQHLWDDRHRVRAKAVIEAYQSRMEDEESDRLPTASRIPESMIKEATAALTYRDPSIAFICDVCFVGYPDVTTFESHVMSRKHLKMLVKNSDGTEYAKSKFSGLKKQPYRAGAQSMESASVTTSTTSASADGGQPTADNYSDWGSWSNGDHQADPLTQNQGNYNSYYGWNNGNLAQNPYNYCSYQPTPPAPLQQSQQQHQQPPQQQQTAGPSTWSNQPTYNQWALQQGTWNGQWQPQNYGYQNYGYQQPGTSQSGPADGPPAGYGPPSGYGPPAGYNQPCPPYGPQSGYGQSYGPPSGPFCGPYYGPMNPSINNYGPMNTPYNYQANCDPNQGAPSNGQPPAYPNQGSYPNAVCQGAPPLPPQAPPDREAQSEMVNRSVATAPYSTAFTQQFLNPASEKMKEPAQDESAVGDHQKYDFVGETA